MGRWKSSEVVALVESFNGRQEDGSFEILRQRHDRTVVRCRLDSGRSAILKLWARNSAVDRIKRWLGRAPVQHERDMLEFARSIELPSPSALGIAFPRKQGAAEALVIEDLGPGENGLDALKRWMSGTDEEHIQSFDSRLLDMTTRMTGHRMLDCDHGLTNIHVTADGRIHRLDLETARRVASVQANARLLGLMLGRLLLTYLFAEQPETERTRRFAERLVEAIRPSTRSLQEAEGYIEENLARQARSKGLVVDFPRAW